MQNIKPFPIRVGFLGNPNSSEPFRFWQTVPWSDENLLRLKTLGFNIIQVNVAWGPRPGDEPLNLEDVVDLPDSLIAGYPQPVPLNCDPSPEARQRRRAELRERSAACHRLDLRTIFHFGAPYNAHMRYGDGPPNCISDEKTTRRYELLVERFATEFPEVDDLLVYTYDQDAWLCSEFGPCPRCLGIPLHERLTAFLVRLASAWARSRPHGRLWWEPWELSAGQVYACVNQLPKGSLGLALHANVAEVMATHPADRWLKNTAALADEHDLPVIVEYWLGGPCEELEPLLYLSHPLVTLRGLRAIAAIPGVSGIKEYYGLDPDREDPNLRMTALFFAKPELSDAAALDELAIPYEAAADSMVEFWKLTSRGMELFPWETSWYIRQVGRSRVDHALSAAHIRGMRCRTPSWCSTRQAVFLRAYEYDLPDDPWLREDIELRCRLAAQSWMAALALVTPILDLAPHKLHAFFIRNQVDLIRLSNRALAYAYHLRETNLANILRAYPDAPEEIQYKIGECLRLDLDNYDMERQIEESARDLGMPALAGQSPMPDWEEAEQALEMLQQNLAQFLATYFLETEDTASKGLFSVTSR